MDNHSGDEHPVHMHRRTFELMKIGDRPMSGLMRDTISMPRFSKAEIDFVADAPDQTSLHSHHRNRVDEASPALLAILELNSQVTLAITAVPRVQEPCASSREPVSITGHPLIR